MAGYRLSFGPPSKSGVPSCYISETLDGRMGRGLGIFQWDPCGTPGLSTEGYGIRESQLPVYCLFSAEKL